MSKPQLHLPIGFEQRDEVRILGRLCGDRAAAVFIVFRLWMDWARAGTEWRALQPGEGGAVDWTTEPLNFIIEEASGWEEPMLHGCRHLLRSQPLIELLLEARVLSIESRVGLSGLVLAGFATENPHLLPEYVSREQKGGFAKAERARLAALEDAAATQAKLFESQRVLAFREADAATPDEKKKSIAMVMGFDTACGKSVRTSSEYTDQPDLLADALAVLRGHSWDEVVTVQRYVAGARNNPEVVKETGVILKRFGKLLRAALDAKEAQP